MDEESDDLRPSFRWRGGGRGAHNQAGATPFTGGRETLQGLRVAFGDEFVLEFDEYRLRRRSEVVPLPPKAFLTLSWLVARAGHLVEKAELLDAVWAEANVEEGGIARNVSLLRKALGDEQAHPRFIKTVATHGYRFIAPVRPLGAGLALQVQATDETAAKGTPACTPPDPVPCFELARQAPASPWYRRVAAPARLGPLTLAVVALLVSRPSGAPSPTGVPDVTLPDHTAGPLAPTHHPIAPGVYERYIRARASLDRRSDPDLHAALAAFEEITHVEPEFALAFSGLAHTYLVLMGRGAMSADEAFPKLETAARRALTLDPSLGEPHVALSAIAAVRSGTEAAIAELRQAIDKQPSLTLGRSRLAETLAFQGRFAEALPQASEAARLDPSSAILSATLADIERQAGDAERASNVARRALERHPESHIPRMTLGRIYLARGEMDGAIRELRLAVEGSGRNAAMLAELGYALARAGQRTEAAAILAELDERGVVRPVHPRTLVLLCWALGDADRAVEALRQWLASDPSAQLVWHDPHFADFRSDPAVAARLGPLKRPPR